MSLTLNEVATIAMRFVFAGCCATACRIADAIIRPATKSRRFIDHLIGDSEQCLVRRAVPSTTCIEADKTTRNKETLMPQLGPGLPPWGPHVRFRRVQTLVREGILLVGQTAFANCGR